MTFGEKLTNIIISEKEYCLFEQRVEKNIKKNTLVKLDLYDIGDGKFLFTTLNTRDCKFVTDYPVRVKNDKDGLYLIINCNYKKKMRFNLETPVWLDPVHLKHILINQ